MATKPAEPSGTARRRLAAPWPVAFVRALVALPAFRAHVRAFEAETFRRLDAIETRIDELEASVAGLAGGRTDEERRYREEALLNQIASVPVAIRELTVRLNRIEEHTAGVANR